MLQIQQYREEFEKYLNAYTPPRTPQNLYKPVSYFLALEGKDDKNQKILSVKNLYKYYSTSKSLFSNKNDFCALKNLNFDVFEGETLGVIGESCTQRI